MTTQADAVQVLDASNSGEIIKATRKELEQYAVIVCSPYMKMVASESQVSQIGDTIRLLLTVRLSEESQNEAMAVAKRALFVAWIALWVALTLGLLQTIFAAPGFVREVSTWRQSSPQQHTAPQPQQSLPASPGAK